MDTINLALTPREADAIKRALVTAERQAISNGRRAAASKASSYAMTAAEFVNVRRKVEEAGKR